MDQTSCYFDLQGQIADGNPQSQRPTRQERMLRGLPKRKSIEGVKDVVVVASGKGGVGKSTCAG